MAPTNQLNQVIGMLRDYSICATCKRLISQDVCCFFAVLPHSVDIGSEYRQLPQFRHHFTIPLLSACKKCGRRAVQSLSSIDLEKIDADVLFQFFDDLLSIEYRALSGSKEVYCMLYYCFESCVIAFQASKSQTSDSCAQTEPYNDGTYKQAMKRIARTMNMKYLIPDLIVYYIEANVREVEPNNTHLATYQAVFDASEQRLASSLNTLSYPSDRKARYRRESGCQASLPVDEADLTQDLKKQITLLHYTLAAARSGREALSQLQIKPGIYADHIRHLLYLNSLGTIQLEKLFIEMRDYVLSNTFTGKFFPGKGQSCVPLIRQSVLPISEAYIVDALSDFPLEMALSKTRSTFSFEFNEQEKLLLSLAVLSLHGFRFNAEKECFIVETPFPSDYLAHQYVAPVQADSNSQSAAEDFD